MVCAKLMVENNLVGLLGVFYLVDLRGGNFGSSRRKGGEEVTAGGQAI
jgi:hypothetical protein